jgi:DUF177 domain-containing protein
MSLAVNLRHLEAHMMELQGELPVEDLALDLHDEMVRAVEPLNYALEAQKLDRSLLLQGRLRLSLQCQCVRCLEPFEYQLVLDSWTRLLSLEGEDKVPVVNDCVDLTPCIREDILLEFPQHPLCKADCHGLPKTSLGQANKTSGLGQTQQESSAWSELDKLKF